MSRKPFDRLAADAVSAEKAGMSYGRWKVLHPHTPEPEYTKAPAQYAKKMLAKQCVSCGCEFFTSARRASSKYCSVECAQREAYRRYAQKHPRKWTKCLYCGKEIYSERGRQFCGPACKEAAYRRRKFDGTGEAV